MRIFCRASKLSYYRRIILPRYFLKASPFVLSGKVLGRSTDHSMLK